MESRSFNKLMYQKECFSEVAMLYISFNSFRSTSASISSRMLNNSFELRRRQMSIQQKFVRHMSDTTRSFCVRSQHAHPRCRPRTNRLVSMFVDECMTFSPASAKSSTRHRITYPFFVLFVLEVCVDLFVPFDQFFQRLRLPGIPHGLFVVRHAHVYFDVFAPSIPGRIHSWGAAWRKHVYPRVAVFVGPHKH